MRTLSMADVRAHFRALLDEVESTHERIVVTRHGRPVAILIAPEDLEGLEETIEIMGDPQLMADIQEGLAAPLSEGTPVVPARRTKDAV